MVKLRPLWLFMATCVVYALYFYIAEVATLNVGDAPTRDAINTYRSVCVVFVFGPVEAFVSGGAARARRIACPCRPRREGVCVRVTVCMWHVNTVPREKRGRRGATHSVCPRVCAPC